MFKLLIFVLNKLYRNLRINADKYSLISPIIAAEEIVSSHSGQIVITTKIKQHIYIFTTFIYPSTSRGIRGRDRMVVGFTTTYAISPYHH